MDKTKVIVLGLALLFLYGVLALFQTELAQARQAEVNTLVEREQTMREAFKALDPMAGTKVAESTRLKVLPASK